MKNKKILYGVIGLVVVMVLAGVVIYAVQNSSKKDTDNVNSDTTEQTITTNNNSDTVKETDNRDTTDVDSQNKSTEPKGDSPAQPVTAPTKENQPVDDGWQKVEPSTQPVDSAKADG